MFRITRHYHNSVDCSSRKYGDWLFFRFRPRDYVHKAETTQSDTPSLIEGLRETDGSGRCSCERTLPSAGGNGRTIVIPPTYIHMCIRCMHIHYYCNLTLYRAKRKKKNVILCIFGGNGIFFRNLIEISTNNLWKINRWYNYVLFFSIVVCI